MQGIVADSSSFTSVPRPTLPGAGASPSVARRSYAQQRMRSQRQPAVAGGPPPLRIGTAARVDPIGLSYSTPVTIWVQRSEDRINRHDLLAPTGKRRLVTAHTQCRHFASRQERQARPLVVGCST